MQTGEQSLSGGGSIVRANKITDPFFADLMEKHMGPGREHENCPDTESSLQDVIISPEIIENRKLARWNIPPLYRRCTFENYQDSPNLVASIREYADEGDSILMTGRTGRGKTHMAVAALRHIGEKNSQYLHATDFLVRLRNAAANHGDHALLKSYTDYSVLVLDDFGAEKMSEYSSQMILLLIEARMANLKRTIITTNLSLEQIAEAFDERIVSRLSAMKVAEFIKGDWRNRPTLPRAA